MRDQELMERLWVAGVTDAMLAEAEGGKGADPVERSAAPAMKAVYTNSPLVVYTKNSPNNSGTRVYPITRITPHCVVGQCYIESLGALFAQSSVQASSNYGIARDGKVGMFVPESKRSWCSSSYDNDHRAVTIECASDTTNPFAMYQVVWDRLVELCVDICRRNGKDKLLWLGSKDKTLAYTPKAGEMLLTAHRWFNTGKSCPGDWLYSRYGQLAEAVTKRLTVTPDTPIMDDKEDDMDENKVKSIVQAELAKLPKQPVTRKEIMNVTNDQWVDTFKDLPEWAKSEIRELIEMGAIKGTVPGVPVEDTVINASVQTFIRPAIVAYRAVKKLVGEAPKEVLADLLKRIIQNLFDDDMK